MANQPMHTRRGFTLVELLVVIGIIAVLISILLPALSKARQAANDIACGSNMRQALLAVAMYNSEYPKGLTNYEPNCPYWGQSWPAAHRSFGLHADWEGRSFHCNWRGYLMAGKYAGYKVLGCSATEYPDAGTYYSSYHNVCINFWAGFTPADPLYPAENTSAAARSFKERPAFVWYGPGSFSLADQNPGNLRVARMGGVLNNTAQQGYAKRIVLFTCPVVSVAWFPTSVYSLPHRPAQSVVFPPGNAATSPYSSFIGNIGMSDGSVIFVSALDGKEVNPL